MEVTREESTVTNIPLTILISNNLIGVTHCTIALNL